mgnify:FL=1|jgi:sensor histidine kinase regulating citrate/malate metabolism
MNLGNLIENAIKAMAHEEAKEEDEDVDDELDYDNIDELMDEDFVDHNQFIEDEMELDEALLASLRGEDEV